MLARMQIASGRRRGAGEWRLLLFGEKQAGRRGCVMLASLARRGGSSSYPVGESFGGGKSGNGSKSFRPSPLHRRTCSGFWFVSEGGVGGGDRDPTPSPLPSPSAAPSPSPPSPLGEGQDERALVWSQRKAIRAEWRRKASKSWANLAPGGNGMVAT